MGKLTMPMEATVCIATYGDDSWGHLAATRAIPSARATGLPYMYAHGETLAEARNVCLEGIGTEWVCFLDADDELEPGYFEAMATATADVRAPSLRQVHDYTAMREYPFMPTVVNHRHDCNEWCLGEGNWIVVGAVARTQLLRDVGGWRDWPMYEDWDLWIRCWLADATFAPVPDAVYRAHVRDDTRNNAPTQAEKQACFDAILQANGLA